jgi:hypothetical protein
LSPAELLAILNTIPFDLTFVDKDDTVRYFTQGRERIFTRSRAILGRQVQYCHPPSSVAIVEQILAAFKSGAKDHAAFWITMRGRFIHIEYYALRDPAGGYLGCLEVSQDLTDKRALTGEQRLLSWAGDADAVNEAASPRAEGASEWTRPDAVVARLDARPILASGGHPLQQVLTEVERIGDGTYELVTPFVPTPLIEKVRAIGYEAQTRQDGGTVYTYFRRAR